MYNIKTRSHPLFRFTDPQHPTPVGHAWDHARVGVWFDCCCGGHSGRETPGPIPNPEAKPTSADGTARETSWESRTPPHKPLKQRGPRYQETGTRALASSCPKTPQHPSDGRPPPTHSGTLPPASFLIRPHRPACVHSGADTTPLSLFGSYRRNSIGRYCCSELCAVQLRGE